MLTLNHTLWILGLLLHCLLLAALFLRGLARRAPLFTTLILFFLLRSILLFMLFGHLSTNDYAFTYTALTMLDLVLQILVAIELFFPRQTQRNGLARPSFARVAAFSALAFAAAAGAWLISILISASPRSPIDRGVLFTSLLMLAIFALSRARFAPTEHGRLLQGFALLGVTGLLSQVGRTAAAFHRNAPAFTAWSYFQAASYLAVLLLWVFVLWPRIPDQHHRPAYQSYPSLVQ